MATVRRWIEHSSPIHTYMPSALTVIEGYIESLPNEFLKLCHLVVVIVLVAVTAKVLYQLCGVTYRYTAAVRNPGSGFFD